MYRYINTVDLIHTIHPLYIQHSYMLILCISSPAVAVEVMFGVNGKIC